jgi:hypothetical protein
METGERISTQPEWKVLYERTKEILSGKVGPFGNSQDSGKHIFRDEFVSKLPVVASLLSVYLQKLEKVLAKQEEEESQTMKVEEEESPFVVGKELTLDVRNALRFTRQCIQPKWDDLYPTPSDDDTTSSCLGLAQRALVECEMHLFIAKILSLGVSGDVKCVAESSKILCNAITSNAETSIIMGDSITFHNSNRDLVNQQLDRNPSWLEMVSGCGRSLRTRDAIGRIAATLFNIMTAFEAPQNDGNDTAISPTTTTPSFEFAAALAKDHLLLCNLARHVLPTTTISESSSESNSLKANGGTSENGGDATTEWISLVFHKVSFDLSLLPHVHDSLGSASRPQFVSMEHVVLYQSLIGTLSLNNSGKQIQLSPDVLSFLATRAGSFHAGREHTVEENYDGEAKCQNVVQKCMYEILAFHFSAVTTDRDHRPARNYCQTPFQSRDFLCRQTSLIKDLVHVMDDTTQRVMGPTSVNASKRSRDMVMSANDQAWIKLIVQLVGSLCYKCRTCQDQLRQVELEVDFKTTNKSSTSTGSVVDSDDDSVRLPSKKNGVHVLLETTTMSPACFGLREWAVVAVRYALEDNLENQQILEKLSPQQALMTPELSSLGIDSLKIDGDGKVRVASSNLKNSGDKE